MDMTGKELVQLLKAEGWVLAKKGTLEAVRKQGELK